MKKFVFLEFLFLSAVSCVAYAVEPLKPYVGTSDFKELTGEGKLFVDKTLLIKNLLSNEKKVILITRPRRWGKSVNMNMLKYFFKEEVDFQGQRLQPQPYKYLFENLKISKEVNLVEGFQGRYPTLLITFKDIEEKTYPEMRSALEARIVRLFAEYKYLSPISHWWEESEKRNDIFLETIRTKVIDGKNIGFKESLRTLSEWLHQHHGKNAFILIDEYDTPLNSASEHGYAKEAVQLIKSVLSPALKDNPHLEKGILTGILRVAGVNLFSGMNSFMEDSVLSNHYSAYYGFTEEEIDQLLIKAQMDNKTEVKKWYNGYTIGGEVIYNPWSIVHYLSTGKTEPYWLRSGTTQLIERAMVSEKIQQDLAVLRSGQTISRKFEKNVDFFNFTEDYSALWPLLLYAGYLTATDCKVSDETSEFICDVKIPNKEIARSYGDFLSDLLTTKKLPKSENLAGLNEIFEAIFQKDVGKVRKLLMKQEFIPFSEEWNFNLLQLGVLSADRGIFEAVYEHYHDANSLGISSKEGLSVGDFASLAGVNYLELQGIDENIAPPTHLEKLCWFDPQILGATVGILKWSYDQLPKPRSPRNQMTAWRHLYSKIGLLLDPGLGVAMGAVVQHIIQPWCKNYQAYQGIDVSKPKLMSRWAQLAKFVNQNPQNYLQLGSLCRSGDEKILNFKQSPFPVYLTLVKQIEFTLCNNVTEP